MSTVQQLLNALKKIFYDLTPVSNKQMSLMPMANGGIGFCKYEAKILWTITQFCTAGISHGGPKQNCCDVTNFHQVATVASASFQSSLFYYPCWKRGSQQTDVSFLCVCPLIDNKLRHSSVKLEPQANLCRLSSAASTV